MVVVMGQKRIEIWAEGADLQPIHEKPGRLLNQVLHR